MIAGAEASPLFVLDLKYEHRPSPLYKAESSLETFLEANKLPTFGKSIAALVSWPGARLTWGQEVAFCVCVCVRLCDR